MANGTSGIVRPFALALVCLSLAGCGTAPLIGPAPQNRVGSEVNVAPNESQRAARPEPAYIPRTDELTGLGEAETEELFGAPALRRADQDAQVWQYPAQDCVLFLFFYPDDAGTARVSYVTSTGRQAGDNGPGDQACVESVTRAAAQG